MRKSLEFLGQTDSTLKKKKIEESRKKSAYYQFFGSVLDVGDEIWVLGPLKPEYLQIFPVN